MNEYGVNGLACSELVQGNTTLKIGIEQTTTRYIQRYTLIETLIPAIVCLFVGPYSDEHGRKLPIVRSPKLMLKNDKVKCHCLGYRLCGNHPHSRLLLCTKHDASS